MAISTLDMQPIPSWLTVIWFLNAASQALPPALILMLFARGPLRDAAEER